MNLANGLFSRHANAERIEPLEAPSPACLVVGLGNCLLRDDGIGVHAVRHLASQLPSGALALEVGTEVFGALSWLERTSRVLAIDAMDAGGPPGTIYHGALRDVEIRPVPASLHELGLRAALEFVPREKWPAISVLGVQPAIIDYGLDLSSALQEALPNVIRAAQAIAASWLNPDSVHVLSGLSSGCEPARRSDTLASAGGVSGEHQFAATNEGRTPDPRHERRVYVENGEPSVLPAVIQPR